MTLVALSTMYAQQPRFDDGGAFARFAREAGFEAIEISHSTAVEKVDAIAAEGALPVVSVHAPAPFRLLADGRPNSALNLASLDERERVAAVEEALRSVRLAERLGAQRVVVHLGHVDPPEGDRLHPLERQLRKLFDRDALRTDEARQVATELLAWRRSTAEPYLEAARRSLEALVAAAAAAGIVIGIETRLHAHEIPLPEEAVLLLAGLDPRAVGYWHDVGHVEVLARLRLVPRSRWERAPGLRLVGVHAHDVRRLLDHRAPGNGSIDWERVRRLAARSPLVTFEIDQREPEEGVLRARGMLGSAPD